MTNDWHIRDESKETFPDALIDIGRDLKKHSDAV